MTAWLEKHRPGPVWSDVANNLSALTINDGNRHHQILEGAHIRLYSSGGAATNVVPNGLLLRSDIHTLFDHGLLWVDADDFVQLSSEPDGSEYTPLRGRKLRLPEQTADHPHPDYLAHHRVHTARQLA